MPDLDTVLDAENGEVEALQAMIDAGTWGLQGSMGRAMADAIERGDCMLGPEPCRDYYGNLVPAWWMIAEGAPGSPEHAGYGEAPPEPSSEEKAELCAAVGLEVPPEVWDDAEEVDAQRRAKRAGGR